MAERNISIGIDPRRSKSGAETVKSDLRSIGREATNTERNLAGIGNSGSKSFGVVSRESAAATRSLGVMTRAAGALGLAIGSALSVSKYAQFAEQNRRIENSLRVAGLAGQELADTYDRLYDSALKNAAPIESLSELYGKVALVQNELGVSSERLAGFTDKVALALRVSGRDAGQASGALLQLSQALGSGTVRAEEFNSILEGVPTIAQAVAAGLEEANGSVARLRQLVVDGKVSSEAFFSAFEAGSKVLEEKAASATLTLAQRHENLNTATSRLVKVLDDATNASGIYGTAIQNAAESVDALVNRAEAAAPVIQKIFGFLRDASTSGDRLGEVIDTMQLAENLDDANRSIEHYSGEYQKILDGLVNVTDAQTQRIADHLDFATRNAETAAAALQEKLGFEFTAGTGGPNRGRGGIRTVSLNTGEVLSETKQIESILKEFGANAVSIVSGTKEQIGQVSLLDEFINRSALQANLDGAKADVSNFVGQVDDYLAKLFKPEDQMHIAGAIREIFGDLEDEINGFKLSADDLLPRIEDVREALIRMGVGADVANRVATALANIANNAYAARDAIEAMNASNSTISYNSGANDAFKSGVGVYRGTGASVNEPSIGSGGGSYAMSQQTASTNPLGSLDDYVSPFGAFAGGGRIIGPGSGTSDSINIRASNGEYVVKADAARSIGYSNLDQMNATGAIPKGYANGGVIEAGPYAGMSASQVPANEQQYIYGVGVQVNDRGDMEYRTFDLRYVSAMDAVKYGLPGTFSDPYANGGYTNAKQFSNSWLDQWNKSGGSAFASGKGGFGGAQGSWGSQQQTQSVSRQVVVHMNVQGSVDNSAVDRIADEFRRGVQDAVGGV